MGSWITYGLGSETKPARLHGPAQWRQRSQWWKKSLGEWLFASVYQGVQCRTTGDPILYVTNPKGINRDVRRRSLDALKSLNEFELKQFGHTRNTDPHQPVRTCLPYADVGPEAVDLASETKATHELYGTTGGAPSFANNCLLAAAWSSEACDLSNCSTMAGTCTVPDPATT